MPDLRHPLSVRLEFAPGALVHANLSGAACAGDWLWVVGDDAIDQNQMSHVRIVTGITGDGSHDGTRIQFIDPATGSNSEESYVDFTRRMEAADPVAAGLGIYHF